MRDVCLSHRRRFYGRFNGDIDSFVRASTPFQFQVKKTIVNSARRWGEWRSKLRPPHSKKATKFEK